MKLYGYWRSSASWRVRIGLYYKGLAFEPIAVHLVKEGGEQHQEEHRRRNPLEQVPVLEVEEDGKTHFLTQSVAILEYLEERYPEPPLLPKDRLARAQVRRVTEIVNSGIQPLQNLSVTQYVKGTLGADDKAWTGHFVARGMDALEEAVRATAGRYAVGDQITLADLAIVPQMYSGRRFNVDVSRYATLSRVEAACYELDAFKKAHADVQPDAIV